ncbi:MAG: putative toxin-antitoxin system toxin component, PIN family [Terracidiphilus sp.]
MTRKVVFDTSCLVSAALRPSSIPDQALTLALKTCQLCASVDGLEELNEVLQRRRFDSYVDLDSRLALLGTVRTHARIFTVTESTLNGVKGSCRDASDDFILALASSAEGDIIVSSDRDLLVLHPWRGIAIMTPAQFVEQFAV